MAMAQVVDAYAADEVIFDAMRPMILNGIGNIAGKNDLIDRTLMVTLPMIPEHKRKLERNLWRDFEKVRPTVLANLLDAVSEGLKNFNQVRLKTLPRMADFAQWIVAAEPKLPWNSGDFMNTYKENQDDAKSVVFESDGFSGTLKDFIEMMGTWRGTATDLKAALEKHSDDEKVTKSKYWPKAPNKVSEKIRHIAPSLRSAGINVEFAKTGKIWQFSCK